MKYLILQVCCFDYNQIQNVFFVKEKEDLFSFITNLENYDYFTYIILDCELGKRLFTISGDDLTELLELIKKWKIKKL